jgi:hypothetical protein
MELVNFVVVTHRRVLYMKKMITQYVVTHHLEFLARFHLEKNVVQTEAQDILVVMAKH